MMFSRISWCVLVAAIALTAPAAAQQGVEPVLSSAEVERIRTEKKAWVALNMDLATADSGAFWPVYDGYQKELARINLRLVRLVEMYATHYRNNSLTDDVARKLTEESFAIDEAELKLRRSYYGRLAKVVSARKAARYLQLESRVHTQVRYELGANLPLAGDVKPDIPRAVK